MSKKMKIGIDFGTCFSLPAGLINGAPATLLPYGEYGMPSVFYYDGENGVQIGKNADKRAEILPQNAKRFIKMGISGDEKSFSADGRTFSTEEIIEYIFKELRKISRKEIERRALVAQDIEGAVISIPAAFDFREQELIRNAAEKSGIEVLGFIREPVAAAIAYFKAPAQAGKEKTILVYDLGGGTCDVAIVRSNTNPNCNAWYDVIDSEMLRIGGRDWDSALIKVVKRKCQEKLGNTFDAEMEEKLRRETMQAKHALSNEPLDPNMPCKALVTVVSPQGPIQCTVTIDEFEEASAHLLQQTMAMVKRVKNRCKTPIDDIVCVGGSSNMPQVKKVFEREFPGIPVKVHNPETAIAFGAAIFAEHLSEENFLRDKCKFSYGARYIENFEEFHDRTRLKIWNIIYKGDNLPASGTSTSCCVEDGNHSVYIAVYESECTDDVYPPEKGSYIGDIEITGIPDAHKNDRILLTMGIGRNGLMSLKAVHEKSGRFANVEIRLNDF
ncbi:MAG: Hsp70 family protein [Planctomycetia bacterium]|nr:Hsp70 family protein [Planctomycetia bacterium]